MRNYLRYFLVCSFLLSYFDPSAGLTDLNKACSDKEFISRNQPEYNRVTASFHVTLSNGLSPEGAVIRLANLQWPDTVYSVMVPETGETTLQAIFPGNYQVLTDRYAYEPLQYDTVLDGTHFFNIELQQETLTVSNLVVDSTQVIISWNKPRKYDVLLMDDFASGSFETNGWTTDTSNWQIINDEGQPPPCARFHWTPVLSNYSESLTSGFLPGMGSQVLQLGYHIRFDSYNMSTVENMSVEVWNGHNWIALKTYDNQNSSFPWIEEVLVHNECIADSFQIRFHAHGDSSININNWNIDNVCVKANEPDFPVLEYWLYLDGDSIATTQDTSFVVPSCMLLYGQDYTVGVEAVYESGTSERTDILFTSFYLPPPKNPVGECVGNDALLSWELPDTLAIHIPEALTGFNIYRDEEWIDGFTADSLAFVDADLMPGTYHFGITALYDLTYFGFSGTGESLPVTVDVFISDFGLDFPFLETWDSASFTVNDWTIGGSASGNWKITSMKGNPPPAAEFSWNPPINNYESWLMSPPLNAAPYDCADYYIEFDLKLEDRHATGKENLSVQVYTNNTWKTLKKFVNSGNTAWESHKLKIPDQSGNTFYIRFFAEGKNTADIYRWLIDNIKVNAECRPPTGLRGEHVYGYFQLYIEWTEPDCQAFSGELVKLYQWDGGPNNAYFQQFNHAYGVVYDLSAYPDAVLEFIDFHHASWNVLGIWSYNVHVVDWDNHELIETLGPFQTTGNDKWENGIQLGQIMGYGGGQIGIMLEPLSHSPTDAFPAFSADNNLTGHSLMGQIPNWSNFTASGVGDFLQNLWIRTAYPGKTEVVKLNPVNPHTTNAKTRKPSGSNDTAQMKQSIESLPGLHVFYSQSTLQGYHVYRKEGWDPEFELITLEPITETHFYDNGPFNVFLGYHYYVTAIYDVCVSIPSNIAEVYFMVDQVEKITQDKFQVFPVPADQSLSVVLTDKIQKLQIINIYGQMVYEQIIGEGGQIHIDTSAFPPGTYFVRGFDGAGNSFSQKVLIAR
jgi:hypothetical protein